MSEISCENCESACCKGNPLLLLQLSLREARFMTVGGNELMTVVEPQPYPQKRAIYPNGAEIDRVTREYRWLTEKGNEYEPLPAGFGRYALLGSCAYLGVDEDDREYCTVYDQRPGVCQDFEVGSEKCEYMRIIQGVPMPNPTRKQ